MVKGVSAGAGHGVVSRNSVKRGRPDVHADCAYAKDYAVMSTRRATEIRVNARLTRQMIQTNPVVLTLTPYERQNDDSGGWQYVSKPDRVAQTVKLIESELVSQTEPQTTIDGIEREVTFELLGMPDMELSLFDRFFLDSVEYEVTHVFPNNGWERRASVVTRG